MSWPNIHISHKELLTRQRRKVDIWVITPFCLILHVSKCFFHYSILLRNGSIFENRVKRLTTTTLRVVGKQSKNGSISQFSPICSHLIAFTYLRAENLEIAVKKCFFIFRRRRRKNAVNQKELITFFVSYKSGHFTDSRLRIEMKQILVFEICSCKHSIAFKRVMK